MRTEIHGVAANLVTKRSSSNSFLYLSEDTYDESLYPDIPLLMGHDTGKLRIGDVKDVIFTDTQLLFRAELFDPTNYEGTEVGAYIRSVELGENREVSMCINSCSGMVELRMPKEQQSFYEEFETDDNYVIKSHYSMGDLESHNTFSHWGLSEISVVGKAALEEARIKEVKSAT